MLYNPNLTNEERFDMPLTGLSNYRVRNNIIYTQTLEINAVRHCNLSCRSCSHSSPIAKKENINPFVVGKDLQSLSRFLKCQVVRILGGEPLLHPSLKELIKEIRHSGISANICLATNGILLKSLSDEMAPYIDEIQISLYPLNESLMNEIKKQAGRFANLGINVELKEISFFRESISQNRTEDQSLAQMIYESCLTAHGWKCLTVHNGRLYRCPQSLVYAEKTSDYSDSINIYDIQCTNDLLRFLENNNACKACSQCLGSIGKLFSHEQRKYKDWLKALPQTPEEGIDFSYAGSFRIF